MAENEKKPKKFNWFGMYNLDGKGIDKSEPPVLDNPNIPNFFKLIWRKLNKLITVNLLMVFGNFPIFFYFIYKAGYFGVESSAPYYQQFAPLYGAYMFGETPVMSMFQSYSRKSAHPFLPPLCPNVSSFYLYLFAGQSFVTT